MMTAEDVTAISTKAIEFIGAHATLRDGRPIDLGRIAASISAMTIVALADSKPDVAREFTQAFMQDVETLVAALVNAKVPAP